MRAAAVRLALAACLALAGCPLSLSDRPVDPATGILNFRRVSADLYAGGQPGTESFARLKAMGVRTVVSLRAFDVDRRRLRGLGMRYVHISFKAPHPEAEDVVRFLKVLADPANRPVFVHCKWGTDRSGMMVAVYRIVVQGWTKERALEEMHRMGYQADAWPQLEKFVRRLDPEAVRRRVAEARPVEVEVVP